MTTPPKFILVMRHPEQSQDPRDPNLSPEGLVCVAKLTRRRRAAPHWDATTPQALR
jgi:hypothetical protein